MSASHFEWTCLSMVSHYVHVNFPNLRSSMARPVSPSPSHTVLNTVHRLQMPSHLNYALCCFVVGEFDVDHAFNDADNRIPVRHFDFYIKYLSIWGHKYLEIVKMVDNNGLGWQSFSITNCPFFHTIHPNSVHNLSPIKEIIHEKTVRNNCWQYDNWNTRFYLKFEILCQEISTNSF